MKLEVTNNIIYNSTLQNEILSYKSKKTRTRSMRKNYKTLVKDIKEELDKWNSTFMDKKTQYSQDVSSSQVDLQIQCNLNQNSSKFSFGEKLTS